VFKKLERTEKMNKPTEFDLIQQATAALVGHGLKVADAKRLRGTPADLGDAWLRIGRGKTTTEYLVETKGVVTPITLGAIIAQLRDRAAAAGKPALLVTRHVTPPVAAVLRDQGQQFVDAAGNAYLEGKDLLVIVTGQKPPEQRVIGQGDRADTANGIKILFALLCDPQLVAAPQRTIAATAGAALGAVPAVLRDLQGQGHLVDFRKRRRLNVTKKLLDEWAFAYARRLRPKTLRETYTTEVFDAWRTWKPDPTQVMWGGEPAAALLTDYLRPGILTFYTRQLPPRMKLDYRFVRTHGPTDQRVVEIRQPFWGETLPPGPKPGVVHPILIYADLLATRDGRCVDTARVLFDNYLARPLGLA
jgi:hypothetical protein